MRLLQRVFRFLNSAFGLWLLSSVVIAAFLNLASEERRCYSTVLSVVPKILKSASERDLRILEIVSVLHSDINEPESAIEEKIKDIMSGSMYFYADYKDKSMLDLEFNITFGEISNLSLGLAKSPDLESSSVKVLIPEFLKLNSSNPMDRQHAIEELRNKSSSFTTMEKALQKEKNIASFPYIFEETARQVSLAFARAPCHPISLIRNRVMQYFHGLQ